MTQPSSDSNVRLALSTPLTLAAAGRRMYQARLIRAGRVRYADNSPGPYAIPAPAIQEAVLKGRFDSIPTFIDHADLFENSSLRNLAGYVRDPSWNVAEQSTAYTDQQLFLILDNRYRDSLPALIITNEPLHRLPGRLRSRLGERGFALAVENAAPDYRLGTGEVTL